MIIAALADVSRYDAFCRIIIFVSFYVLARAVVLELN